MAIVLKKADLSMLLRLGIIDTLTIYVDDVLVASVSDENSVAWALEYVIDEATSLPGSEKTVVIQVGLDQQMNLSDLVTEYAPVITEGPSGTSASVNIQDITLYIPGEFITVQSSASAPGITEAYYGTGGSVFAGASAVQYISLGASMTLPMPYEPIITEGPSGNASVGYNASVTMF